MLIKAESEVNMSDLNQVYLIANEFAKWWAENPELRFGQMVELVFKKANVSTKPGAFYLDNEQWLQFLKNRGKIIKHYENESSYLSHLVAICKDIGSDAAMPEDVKVKLDELLGSVADVLFPYSY